MPLSPEERLVFGRWLLTARGWTDALPSSLTKYQRRTLQRACRHVRDTPSPDTLRCESDVVWAIVKHFPPSFARALHYKKSRRAPSHA